MFYAIPDTLFKVALNINKTEYIKMADKLVTWVFALHFSDNFTVLWNEIKKIIHIYMLRTLLSTSYGNFMLNIWTLNS
jgi:hypothetical protein